MKRRKQRALLGRLGFLLTIGGALLLIRKPVRSAFRNSLAWAARLPDRLGILQVTGGTSGSSRSASDTVARYDASMRLTHWLHLVGFLLLTWSGLALIWPPLGFHHPVIMVWMHRAGAIPFIIGPLFLLILHRRRALKFLAQFVSWKPSDVIWLLKFPLHLLLPRRIKLPFTRLKLNPGQRLVSGLLIIFGVLLAVSGFVRLLEGLISPDIVARARLLHRLMVPPIIVFFLAHAYIGFGLHAAFIGAWRTMLGDGKATHDLARLHWPGWYEEVRQGKPAAGKPKNAMLRGIIALSVLVMISIGAHLLMPGATPEATVPDLPEATFAANLHGHLVEVRVAPNSRLERLIVHQDPDLENPEEDTRRSNGISPALIKAGLMRALLREEPLATSHTDSSWWTEGANEGQVEGEDD